MKQALTYIEIDVPVCANTYGVAPCTASIPTTGAIKCFNSVKTCQAPVTLVGSSVTLRFAVDTDYLPHDIEAIPSIASLDDISFTPAIISLGKDLGQRATLEVIFTDHPDADTGLAGDKYLSTRTYNPFSQGTFWGKFRARYPYLQNLPLRWINGYLGQALAEMETRHFIITGFDGPTLAGKFTLQASDVLKLADGEQAQAPGMSQGYLVADITAADINFTLTPAGIGASYPASGVLNLGGSELVSFGRDPSAGNDANCLLLLHCDGTNASTAFTDSSASARAVTANGNAQVSTAQSKFGGASATFDGAGDYLSLADNNAWTPAGNFTFDCWVRLNTLTDFRAIFSHGTDGNNKYQLFVAGDGRLIWEVKSAGAQIVAMTAPAGTIVDATWLHVALVRNGNVWTIYVGGVAVATTTDSDAIPNFTGTFKVGIDQDGTSNPFKGWIEEFRFSGAARWTAPFTPPVGPYASSGDSVSIVRGQLNTVAAAHKAQDRAQLVLQYSGADVADILYDLFVTYAGVPSGYIDLVAWKAETAAFLGNVYSASICEPTAVNALVSELIEQAALAVWWDDLARKLRMQVLRAVVTTAFTFTPENIWGSLSTREQPEQRLSRVQTYFGQINPLLPLSNKDNYRSTSVRTSAAAEAAYGARAIHTIMSRWIAPAGRTVADRLGDIVLGRYSDPPRHIGFDAMRYAGTDAVLGAGYQVQSPFVQDATGAASSIPIQVTQLSPLADRFRVDAEEMLFTAPPLVPTTDDIVLGANDFNINLQVAHDSIYPPAVSGDTVNCTISAGIIIGSHSTSSPAFDIGTFAAGVTVNLKILGRIQGKGGDGGVGGAGHVGLPGGLALYTRRAIGLDVAAGQIWSGGGGGAASGASGGGGAGQDGGAPGGAFPGQSGASGTATAGGAGGTTGNPGGIAGAGGGPGLAGLASVWPAAGGAAGNAIDGVSYITVTAGPGDIRGAQIN